MAWHRSADAATPAGGDWEAWSGQRNQTYTKLGDLFVLPMPSEAEAQVWTSRDLLHWTKRKLPVEAGEILAVKAVTIGGPGLMAYGYGEYDNSPLSAFWTSTDGSTWSRIQGSGLPAGQEWLLRATGEGNVSYLTGPVDVTQFPGTPFPRDEAPTMIVSQGGITAFESRSDTKGPIAMWQAIGTTPWRQVHVLPNSYRGTAFNATQGPRGYVVFGCGTGCTGGVGWWSPDGDTWKAITTTEIDGINGVVATSSGFIAYGERGTGLGCAVGSNEIFGTTWTSADGRKWTKMKEQAQFNGASIHVAIVDGATLFGLGIRYPAKDADYGGPISTVWTAPLPADSVATIPAPAPTPAPSHAGCGD